MTTIKAYFDGKVFVPEEPVRLPHAQRVTLQVEPDGSNETPKKSTIQDLLANIDKLAVRAQWPIDDSRDSIYSGTIDDPR